MVYFKTISTSGDSADKLHVPDCCLLKYFRHCCLQCLYKISCLCKSFSPGIL